MGRRAHLCLARYLCPCRRGWQGSAHEAAVLGILRCMLKCQFLTSVPVQQLEPTLRGVLMLWPSGSAISEWASLCYAWQRCELF